MKIIMHTEIIVSYNRFMEISAAGEREVALSFTTSAVSPVGVPQSPVGAERTHTPIVFVGVHLLCIH